ncbi:MAG: hypothetical protein RQ715_11205 [Methylococcales bacterium]|nr:hypothetical protein [Methylococcales bacterium]
MTATQAPGNHQANARQQRHRLFGLILEDRFYGSPYRVEVEVDVSRQTQLLDVVVVEQEKNQAWPVVRRSLTNRIAAVGGWTATAWPPVCFGFRLNISKRL